MRANNERTGRTSRMLEEAKRLALVEHRAVYVLCAHERQARALERQCFASGEPNLGIKFETPGSLPEFNWQTMSLPGAHPNCVVLVDHYAIELRYACMLHMLHAFDNK